MLGHYMFLYQLEILQEEAEISEFRNITPPSALPPHIRGETAKVFSSFHMPQMPNTSNACKLSWEAVPPFSCWKPQPPGEGLRPKGQEAFFPVCFYKHEDHKHLLSCIQASPAILKTTVHLSSSCTMSVRGTMVLTSLSETLAAPRDLPIPRLEIISRSWKLLASNIACGSFRVKGSKSL